MRNFLKTVFRWVNCCGIDVFKFMFFLKGIVPFLRDRRILKKQLKKQTDFRLGRSYPCLADRFAASGIMKGHYFQQDLLIAQRIYDANPNRHIDIGSRTDGFVAHVATFRKIEMFDIRQQESYVENIVCKQADLMQLPTAYIDSCDSISSLHAIEHFGLGRYSDAIDVNGHIKAFDNIYKMLKINGIFYFSAPIGPQRIEFNAHRVFSLTYLLDLFKNRFQIEYFSFVDDHGNLHKHIEMTESMIKKNCNCTFGCGIFELRKI